jgi:nucleoside-diphosphate kinase
MAKERTLCIIKPDTMRKRRQGAVLQRLLDEGFEVLALSQLRLTRSAAEGFYAVHRGKAFYEGLCKFMTSGPIVVMALQRDDAVRHYREVIGATDPGQAAEGTVRRLYGTNVCENAVHGSDSVENGLAECAYFFAECELNG